MKYNVCSISYRHELVSFRDLVRFAGNAGFTGVELWGVHALSLFRNNPLDIARIVKEMAGSGISVSMISDYLDLTASDEKYEQEILKWRELISLARLFQTDKIRIFAGNRGSAQASASEWEMCTARLREIAAMSEAYGIYTVIETHPGTYADNLESVFRLIAEVKHPNLRLNLDFLHMWECGCPPVEAYRQLKPWVINFHLKNVVSRDELDVFLPENVYSPSGSRGGMVPLADGAIDYKEILHALEDEQTPYSSSIEWFGAAPSRMLKSEMSWLLEVENAYKRASYARG